MRMSYIYGHPRPYQTLIFPNHVVEGMRGTERMEIIRPHLPAGCSVAEFGCNSGMDGVLGVARKYISSYWGVDQDAPSVELGQSVADAWKVRVTLVHGDLAKEDPPEADVLFLFSLAQRISRNVILTQAKKVKASMTFVESHPYMDDATASLMGRLGGSCEEIGTVPGSSENPDPRHLFMLSPQ